VHRLASKQLISRLKLEGTNSKPHPAEDSQPILRFGLHQTWFEQTEECLTLE
jgi:hypothetical protein